MITGNDLIEFGLKPGPKFKQILEEVNSGVSRHEVGKIIIRQLVIQTQEIMERKKNRMPLREENISIPVHYNIEAQSELEEENVEAVKGRVKTIARTPTVTAISVMPDACPTGPTSVPVGTVVAAENAIHPGWHSADVCCSMYASSFGKADPKKLMDHVLQSTHFGPGGRNRDREIALPAHLSDQISEKRGTRQFFDSPKIYHLVKSHFATQGDGNHFAYVGTSEATGETWLITHHGSRGVGAALYKAGMKTANMFRRDMCPELHKNDAWIPFNTSEGKQYWDDLQLVREWTKQSHKAIHELASREMPAGEQIRESHWNEHNFVFREGSTFYHAKGATPIHPPYLPDMDMRGFQIVPLNMAQPILFVRGRRTKKNLGFAPHGAGRNMSRTAHKKLQGERPADEILAEETGRLDIRFWTGKIDISELPSAYKNAFSVQKQMEDFKLAWITDRIMPHGSIMAGMFVRQNRR